MENNKIERILKADSQNSNVSVVFAESKEEIVYGIKEEALPEFECPKGCGLLIKPTMKNTHNCVYELHQIVDKQSHALQELRDSLKKLRKSCLLEIKRRCDRETEWRAGIEEKISILSNRLNELSERDSRRCHGRCTKHVKTEKCLCQGFSSLPHVCCGKEGGICDC